VVNRDCLTGCASKGDPCSWFDYGFNRMLRPKYFTVSRIYKEEIRCI
jgi:hypothetical protein